ncbi:DUF2946 domain-containing protein [Malikia granosa]|uniref:DUF2946 domain-containing protein n=1 Tax=Malikia granosa TaxID=263067 RepID=A0A2S9K630_9BURK|nr:DUF2946 domain-containing protein [Malikia granosa]PRD65845.1 hypothetical protein C6P64_07020 [Malikia granosa]
MFITRSTRRITAWLAMLVLVLNALTPLAAQAMWASGQATNMVEVCTSTGMVRVAIDAADDLDDAGSSAFAQSCPFCLLHDGQAMPPPSATAFPLTESYAGMPPAFYQATHTSAVWLAALSRGPPLLLS